MKKFFIVLTIYFFPLFSQQIVDPSMFKYSSDDRGSNTVPGFKENTDRKMDTKIIEKIKQMKTENIYLTHQVDSLKSSNEKLHVELQNTTAEDNYAFTVLWDKWEKSDGAQKYENAIGVSFIIIICWVVIVIVAIGYFVYRYHFNGGFPKKKFRELIAMIDGDDSISIEDKIDLYPDNPYKDETLALPKGTVRGLLTLTLLIAVFLVLYIGAYAPPGPYFNEKTSFITTAFLMMIAFYFGSKAVDVLQAREKTRRERGEAFSLGGSLLKGNKKRPVNKPKPEIPVDLRAASRPNMEIERQDSKTFVVKSEGQNELPPLKNRILLLTAYFETGKKVEDAFGVVAGNFDGQGISFGCLQWNFGQGTLQPILQSYYQFGNEEWKNDSNLVQLQRILERPKSIQLEWADSIQENRGGKHVILPEWKKTFELLGKNTREFQQKACEPRFKNADKWCMELGVVSERALALMFDISVQNGLLFRKITSRNIDVKKSITQRITNTGSPSEEQKLIIVAEERAKASSPRWINDVLSRKLAIAKGKGKVHGAQIDLDDFNISLDREYDV